MQAAERAEKYRFLSLMTLTFDFDLEVQTRLPGTKHVFRVNLAQIRSGVSEIFHTKKSQTGPKTEPQPHFPLMSYGSFLANVNLRSRSLYAIARPSVCRLSVVCLSSVTFVRPTQAVQIFGNISTALGTLAIH